MSSKGRIVVVSGPSGVGKSTIVSTLMSYKPKGLIKSISATTRAPRAGEVDGVNYTFWTRERFEQAVEQGELLEHAQIYGNWYGTPKAALEVALSAGKNVLLEIDIQGAISVRRLGLDAVYVFIVPPSLQDLKKRLKGRDTPADEMKRRLKAAEEELSYRNTYDIQIVNDTVEEAVRRLQVALRRAGILEGK